MSITTTKRTTERGARRAGRAAIVPLIGFDRSAHAPFYKQISDGYRAAILTGRLRPGQRLPSTRALAGELRISRLPVLNAFEQLLHEGYIEGHVGSGTYVRSSIPEDIGGHAAVETPPRVAERPHVAVEVGGGLGPFRVSLPALDRFPHVAWNRLVSRHARRMSIDLMAYGEPTGHLPLRKAIAHYLRTARAVRCEADQVLVVSGSQQALQICALALLQPGDTVCLEEPGYPGARDALSRSGAAVQPVAVDDEGIDVERMASYGARARVAYVTPSHQYPLGTSMTASRRIELLEWARRRQSWIIEDDYDSEYRYASRPLGALQGMDAASRVVYIGTFSKVLFPSLRIGYLVVPRELMVTFASVRESLDIFSPTLYQAVLTDFIQDGHFARHLRRMRAIYASRRDALVEGLRARLDDVLTIHNADAGLHLAAFLPPGTDDGMVVRQAAARGISATALSTCYAGTAPKSGLILGFGGAPEGQVKRAVRTLEEVIRREL